MTDPDRPPTEDTAPDHTRSGSDVADAIGVAERGTSVEEVHDRGTEATSGAAPVEQRAGDPEMTEGQVVHGEGGGRRDEGAAAPGGAPAPADQSSGVAQSVVGGRVSDDVAADEEQPGG